VPDSLYLLLIAGYVIGGLLCLAIAATGFRGANRLPTGLVGLVAVGYALYLFFSTGDVWLFPIAVIIPFILALRTLRNSRTQQLA